MLTKILNMFIVFAVGTTINLSTLDNNATIYAKGEDSIQATEMTIVDGENETNITEFPYKLESLDEKTYTLKSGEKTFTLKVDNTAPAISITGVENNKTYKTAHVKVKITGSTTQNVEIKTPAGPVKWTEAEREFDATQNGNYTLKVTAADEAGNTSEEELKFKIYNTNPVIAVTGLEKEIQNVDYNIAVSVTSEYPVTSEIKLDNNVVQSPITVSEEGTHTLTVHAEDELGNESNYSKTFTLDKTAPVIVVEGIDKASYNTDVHYKVTGADTVTINGTTAEAEGTLTEERSYTLVAEATDAAGNKTVVTKQFRIKRSAPEIIITGLDKEFYNTDVNYSVTADDAIVVVKLDGSEISSSGTISANGRYEMTVRAEDDAGNYSTAKKNFTIDKTKPVITITGIEDGKFYSSSVSYTVECTDSVTTTQDTITLDGNTAGKTGIVETEGQHILSVTSVDECGNESQKVVHFTIDETDPEVKFNDVQYVNDLRKVIATGTDTNLDSVELEATFKDKTLTNKGESEVKLKEDAKGESVDDKWDFIATAEDKAGNFNIARKTIHRDTVEPKIVMTQVAPYVNKDVNFTAKTEDANPQEITITVRRSGSEKVVKGTDKASITLSTEGRYDIKVVSVDKAGNKSESSTSFTLDKTAPVATLTAPRGYNKSANEVSVRSNEPGDTFMKVVLDGKVIYNGKTSSFTNLRKDGIYKVTAYAVDLAGNKSQDKTAEFVIDSTSPEVSLSGVRDGAYYNSAVNITATVSERFYEGTKVSVSITNVKGGGRLSFPFDCSRETTRITNSYNTNGTYKIKMTATDKAGNTASTSEITFTIDTKKPVVTINVPAKGKYDAVIAPRVDIKDENFQSKTITLTKSEGKAYTDKFDSTGGTRTYANFKKIRANDGVYTLSVTATDKAGNTTTDSKNFIVNRFGSTFKTMNKPDEYGRYTKKDVVVREANLSGIKSFKCMVVRDSEEFKAEGVKVKNGDKTSTYTIPSSNFEKEGVYKIRIETVDNAGNTSKYNSDFSFTIDKTPPVITYTGVESGKVYKENTVKMYVSAKDSLTKNPKIAVTIDGRRANIEKDDGGYYVIINNGYNQTIVMTATDKAGNKSNVTVDKVSVSTSKFAFFISHKGLTIAIIAALAILGVLVAVILSRREKEEEQRDKGDDMVL